MDCYCNIGFPGLNDGMISEPLARTSVVGSLEGIAGVVIRVQQTDHKESCGFT